MLNFLLILLFSSHSFINCASHFDSKEEISLNPKANLRLFLLADSRVVAAFDSGRDLSSFLIHVERGHNKNEKAEFNMDSLLADLEPCHHLHLNHQILNMISNCKGSEDKQVERFLLKCLQKSVFQAGVWYTFCQLRSLNRLEFIDQLRRICASGHMDAFYRYFVFEFVSTLTCAFISFLPSSVLILYNHVTLYLILSSIIYYFAYQSFASII